MTEKTYTYPDWLSDFNIKWEKLEPAFREYFLRRAGYDTTDDGDALLDIPESEALVLDWMYGKNLDSHFWCAKGFHQARAVLVDEDRNLAMSNDIDYFKLIAWAARRIYERGIDSDWWDDTITQDQFVNEHNNKWARSL
jgi:hypothetical protein